MKRLETIILLLCLFLLNNCINPNSKTPDEFLVKKKDPLVLPPEFDELPLPDSEKKKVQKNSSIQSVFGSSGKSAEDQKNKSKLEDMILKELKKKN